MTIIDTEVVIVHPKDEFVRVGENVTLKTAGEANQLMTAIGQKTTKEYCNHRDIPFVVKMMATVRCEL